MQFICNAFTFFGELFLTEQLVFAVKLCLSLKRKSDIEIMKSVLQQIW
jgi:hypothetical protein